MVASLTVHASTNLASSVLSMARLIVGMKSSKSIVCCLLRLILRCTIIRSGKLGQCHKWQQTYAEPAWTHSFRLGETPLCLLREDELPIHCYLKVPPVCHGPRDVYTRHLVLQKLGEAFVTWGVPSSATKGGR